MTDSHIFKPILVSMGDPAGIGPEITIKAWQSLRNHPELAFAYVAPENIFSKLAGTLKTPNIRCINHPHEAREIFSQALPILESGTLDRLSTGQPDAQNSAFITRSIETSVKACLSGKARGLVTNPISKDVLYKSGFAHPGHTEYLGHLTDNVGLDGPRGPVMMLSGGGLKVALVTVHMSLQQAIASITHERIVEVARVLDSSLKRDFDLKSPRIALCGLNPHAGENGTLGFEEQTIINPAAQTLRAQGIKITDAQSADSLFHADARKHYDAVLAMYHDQGLIPVKTLDFHGGVNITLGLPIIRTSPDHGTAFDIAGQNMARADSLIAAIKEAHNMAQNRYA